MRGGDGCGVSTLEPHPHPHLVAHTHSTHTHSGNEPQQRGRGPRRSSRNESRRLPGVVAQPSSSSSQKGKAGGGGSSSKRSRAEGAAVRNELPCNGASSSSSHWLPQREESGPRAAGARLAAAGSVGAGGGRVAAMKNSGVDIPGSGVHDARNIVNDESTSSSAQPRGRRYGAKGVSEPSPSQAIDINLNTSGKGELHNVRNGFSLNGDESSSSIRAEQAAAGSSRMQRPKKAPSERGTKRGRGSSAAATAHDDVAVAGRMTMNGFAVIPNGYHKRGPKGKSRKSSLLDSPEKQQPRLQAADEDIVDACDEEVEQQEPLLERERVGEYFPHIPDELGLQCLTRLPRYRIHNMALVCKKWKEYLLSAELYKARRHHNLREDWVFILGVDVDKKWRAFVPKFGKWIELPPCPSDVVFDMSDKESMVAGLNLLVLGQKLYGYVIWKFDTVKSEWSATPRMHTDRSMFGSASFGKYAYFAGGSSRPAAGTQPVEISAVERYNSETNTYEKLADMNNARKACSGFVMDEKFHVIGGHCQNNLDSSGDAYDPQTNTWTLIPEMWPRDFVPNTSGSPPLVAVLHNQLYAINIISNTLMLYDKENNRWNPLEEVPYRAANTNGWGLGFKAVGDELFVIGGARGHAQFLPMIHAYKPRADGGQTWRLVTDLKIPTNGFIYNCVVMSG